MSTQIPEIASPTPTDVPDDAHVRDLCGHEQGKIPVLLAAIGDWCDLDTQLMAVYDAHCELVDL